MALLDLPSDEQKEIVSCLSPELMEKHTQQRPKIFTPSAVDSQGKAGDVTIVSGYPVFVEDKTQFKGYIAVIALIPIFDQFDVYDVFDAPDMRTPRTVIATTRGSKKLDGIHARFGGVLKELYFEDKTNKEHGLFLEAMYYTRLQ